MARHFKNRNHSAKMVALRPFVDFNYDLSKPLKPNQLAKIDRYYEALNAIKARANKVYRGRSKARVRQVQTISRNEFESLPGFKVAFVESTDANPVRVAFDKKGRVKLKARYFDMGFIPFDQFELARDAHAEISRAMAEDEAAKWFRVSTGKYSMLSPFSRRVLPGKLVQLIHKYSPSAADPAILNSGGKTKEHLYEYWLNGLIPMHPTNQAQLDEFLTREMRDRQTRKKARKAERERERVKRKKADRM